MDEETYEDTVAEAQRELEDVRLRLLDIPDEATLPFSYRVYTPNYEELSFESLVRQQETHQTYHAAHSVHTHTGSSSTGKESASEVSVRKGILSAYYDNLRLQ